MFSPTVPETGMLLTAASPPWPEAEGEDVAGGWPSSCAAWSAPAPSSCLSTGELACPHP